MGKKIVKINWTDITDSARILQLIELILGVVIINEQQLVEVADLIFSGKIEIIETLED